MPRGPRGLCDFGNLLQLGYQGAARWLVLDGARGTVSGESNLVGNAGIMKFLCFEKLDEACNDVVSL